MDNIHFFPKSRKIDLKKPAFQAGLRVVSLVSKRDTEEKIIVERSDLGSYIPDYASFSTDAEYCSVRRYS